MEAKPKSDQTHSRNHAAETQKTEAVKTEAFKDETPKNDAAKSADPKSVAPKSAALEKITDAAKGLLYISETDAPLEPFFWPAENEKLAPGFIAEQAKLPTHTKFSTQTLDEFFDSVAKIEDWMNEDEKSEAQRFQKLQKTLEENLKNIAVFRAGETNMDVFVIGETEGGFAGLHTKVVET